jgi:hypothetical protein
MHGSHGRREDEQSSRRYVCLLPGRLHACVVRPINCVRGDGIGDSTIFDSLDPPSIICIFYVPL